MVDTNNNQNPKKTQRIRNFHLKYLELCRSKNFSPIPEIKKTSNHTVLDFFGDKFKIDDWLFIIEALNYDQTLQNIGIRLRKNSSKVLDNIDTEKRARLFRNKPMIFTKYIFMGLIDSISNCLKCNRHLITLALEALPFSAEYATYIAKALSENETIQTISFCRSSICDKGCEILCNAIKVLPHIENVYMCNCLLTAEGAEHIANMIKFQKIYRFSEGWKNSLRYRDVDADSIPGLQMIFIAQNRKIGDEGTKLIAEVLKEDAWIKVIDMEDCGLTNIGAKYVLDCLEMNQSLIEFNIRGNVEINYDMFRNIRVQLGKDPDSDQVQYNGQHKKLNITKLRERLKLLEDQIITEQQLRKQTEQLNEQLHEQIMCYERQLKEKQTLQIPDGYIIVEENAWNDLLKERNELKRTASLKKITKNLGKKSKLKKAKSEINPTLIYDRCRRYSKSEHQIQHPDNSRMDYKHATTSIYVENSIGDTLQTDRNRNELKQEMIASKNLMGMDALKVFMSKKVPDSNEYNKPLHKQAAPKSLFMGDC